MCVEYLSLREKDNPLNLALDLKLNDLTKGVGGLFTDIFTPGLFNKEAKKESKKQGVSLEMEGETIKDPIFKKVQALKKILSRFSNKTYTIKEEDEERSGKDFEISIKIEICRVLSYVMDLREDFLIDNTVAFFIDKFLPNMQNLREKNKDAEEAEEEFEEELLTVLPNMMLKVGGGDGKTKRKMVNFTKFEEICSFDDMIERPFLECLLLSFYFTNNSQLQTALLKLLQKCVRAGRCLRDNLNKLDLLFSVEHKMWLSSFEKKIAKVKTLTALSQVWIQIAEQEFHQQSYEDQLIRTHKTLSKIETIFQFKSSEEESLKIKQRIFKHLRGHEVLIELIDQGLVYFDHLHKILEEYNEKEFKPRYNFSVVCRITNVYKSAFSILGLFCLRNQPHQKMLFKYLNFLMSHQKLNLGQVELVCSILAGNIQLANGIEESQLMYFVQMITRHGRHSHFLTVFENLVKDGSNEISIEIRKKVLRVLLDTTSLNHINVNFPHTPSLI